MMTMTESEFQRQVIDLLRLFNYRVAHFTAAQNQRGQWRTPVSADGKGFPDLVAVRPASRTRSPRVLFVELKTDTGRLSKEQDVWALALVNAGAEHYVWRPRDWEAISNIVA